MRPRSSEVLWHNLVWHRSRIPKHAFYLWLEFRAAHKTKDKLLAIGVLQSAGCVFFCRELESLEHLYFQCPYTENIWKRVLALCNISKPILSWLEEVQWMIEHMKGDNFLEMVRKLALAATVFHIWLERNRRCFNNRFLSSQEII
ncbi:zf-RVT domain-containing protein [Cephalotus follicularis]|uniref:Zf-RVT domain-containing protein n=1 Tax=Cephalotus follicularis TaxID=3775 RepID=A0A1Q3CIM4_CEPFO|nr:zf-RVT domain-containing protein [Cephalotus follicularis]